MNTVRDLRVPQETKYFRLDGRLFASQEGLCCTGFILIIFIYQFLRLITYLFIKNIWSIDCFLNYLTTPFNCRGYDVELYGKRTSGVQTVKQAVGTGIRL
jgi:hypothetical protein